jgi:hypothetical protein
VTQSEISGDWHVYSGHRVVWRDNFGDSAGSLRATDPPEARKTKASEKLVRYMQAVRKIAGEFDASERAQRLLTLKRRFADNVRRGLVQ